MRGVQGWLIVSCVLLAATPCACDNESSDDDKSETEAPRKKKRRSKRKTKKHHSAPTAGRSATPTAQTASPPSAPHPGLKDPAQATLTAPAAFEVRLDTTKGVVLFACDRAWAPHGVDRFYNLVKIGFFNDVVFFRVLPKFVVQWGIHGDPAISKVWNNANLPVDPVVESNTRGMVSFAMAGSPTTRSTQLFINVGNNPRLDKLGFAPICRVTEGMDVVDRFFSGHGEKVSYKQARIQQEGNAYLRREWPGLDFIIQAKIL